MGRLIRVALFVLSLTTGLALASEPGGYIEISLVTYFDSVRQLQSGDCCRGWPQNGLCTITCHNELHACLKNSSSSKPGCLSEFTTDTFITARPLEAKGNWAVQKFSFEGDDANKQLLFSGPVTDGLEVGINASNHDEQSSVSPIASFVVKLPKGVRLATNGNFSSMGVTAPTETTRWIVYNWRLVCNENYYGKCDAFCTPSDNNQEGHYTCDIDGNKVCLDGYEDAATNCVKAVDYCLSNPCENDGSCNQTLACECPPNYYPCTSPACKANPCEHLTQCKMRPAFKCLCTSKYSGEQCETKNPPLSGSEIAAVVVSPVAAVLVILLTMWQCGCFKKKYLAL